MEWWRKRQTRHLRKFDQIPTCKIIPTVLFDLSLKTKYADDLGLISSNKLLIMLGCGKINMNGPALPGMIQTRWQKER